MNNRHIIHRQVTNLSVRGDANKLLLQQRIERLVDTHLLSRLEMLFDRLAGPDQWIELDKVEVEVGPIPTEDADTAWLERILRACERSLDEAIRVCEGSKPASLPHRTMDVLRFFLRHGRYPWWVSKYDLSAAVERTIPMQGAEIVSLLDAPTARRRWVRQIDEKLQFQLLDFMLKDGEPSISLQEWKQLLSALSERQLSNTYWEAVWQAMQERSEFDRTLIGLLYRRAVLHSKESAHQFRALVQRKQQIPPATKAELIRAFDNVLSFSPAQWLSLFGDQFKDEAARIYWAARQEEDTLQDKNQDLWIKRLMQRTLDSPSVRINREVLRRNIDRSSILATEIKSRLLEALDSCQAQSLLRPNDGRPLQRPSPEPSPTEPDIFVPFAGIVLIQAFLPALFERAGLLENGQFTNEENQERALHLLYYLANGSLHPAEPDLVLFKLLCGLQVDSLAERHIDLNDTETKEAHELLLAITRRWTILEGAGPEELRNTFFRRNGKLNLTDNGWQLKVEVKDYDIVLARLPWGISPILHTWMQRMIWVDWA